MSEYDQPFSHTQLRALDIAARVSACMSLSGSSFTIISFSLYRPLRKPVNRLAFSIAVANIFACLAYSWGQYPIKAGRDTAWCQTQGFFINWFVMTDPLLVLIMAFNVLLTVRTKRKATELKKIDLYAVLLAFILPFIPALVFLCWRPNGKTVYGPATLWCWIAKESDILRLVAFYVPIWCFILCAIFLFALSGKQILIVRKKVKNAKTTWVLNSDEPEVDGVASPEGAPPPRERRFSSFAKAFLAPSSTRDSGRTATTRTLTNDQPLADPSTSAELKGLEPLAPIHSHEVLDLEAQATGHNSHQSSSPSTSYDRALTLVESTTWATSQSVPISPLDRSASDQPVLRSPQYNNSASNQPTNSTSRRPSSRFDRIHWKYAKFAFLCTIVLFITWVPISVNRVYNNFISPNHQIYGLYFSSALCIPLHGFGNFVIYTTTSWRECMDFIRCASGARRRRRRKHRRREMARERDREEREGPLGEEAADDGSVTVSSTAEDSGPGRRASTTTGTRRRPRSKRSVLWVPSMWALENRPTTAFLRLFNKQRKEGRGPEPGSTS